jgi:hypothetical protein
LFGQVTLEDHGSYGTRLPDQKANAMDFLVLRNHPFGLDDECDPRDLFRSPLASPFLLVQSVGHNERTWIPLFSLCYFHHEKDSNQQCSKHQAHTMDGIVIGRSPTLNALMVYNPRNQQYHEPDSYPIDPYRLFTLVYPDIKYDGGLFCSCPWSV